MLTEAQYEAKEEAICHGCRYFDTKPARVDIEGIDTDEVESIVSDIADIVAWEDAGFETDWTVYDFQTKQLARTWRQAEAEVNDIRQHRMQIFIRSWLKEK